MMVGQRNIELIATRQITFRESRIQPDHFFAQCSSRHVLGIGVIT